MSSARRSLLTATAAGTLLGALWFVPSANATADKTVEQQHRADTSAASSLSTMSDFTQPISVTTSTKNATTTTTSESAPDSGSDSTDGTRLADTGSFDTTPYVVGGTLCLGLGAGFVVYSLRRERLGF
ncbi:cell wall protein [Streptomyces sp. NPDC020898]|uniref:cell wall protein n=1 Tax=Streptomyces sp. NPDC020898 TaxID=3365101 RepID=UPI0037966167